MENSWSKWTKLSIPKCQAVAGILKTLLDTVGHLPERLTPDSNELRKAGDLLNYAERVLNDEEYWQNVPAVVKPSEARCEVFSARIESVKKLQSEQLPQPEKITKVIDRAKEFSGGNLNEVMLEVAMGKPKEEVREELRALLESCINAT